MKPSTIAGVSLARVLAMEGKRPQEIVLLVTQAGYRIVLLDAFEIWEACQDHKAAVRKALT